MFKACLLPIADDSKSSLMVSLEGEFSGVRDIFFLDFGELCSSYELKFKTNIDLVDLIGCVLEHVIIFRVLFNFRFWNRTGWALCNLRVIRDFFLLLYLKVYRSRYQL